MVWGQRLPWGETRYLGGVMGQNMFLPDFAKVALRYRAEWFTNPLEVRTTGDPAGEAASNQGVPQRARRRAARDGRDGDVHACRRITRRSGTTRFSSTASAMQRRTRQGEAFRVNPRFVLVTPHGIKHTEVLVDAFEAGYVWDERVISNTLSPSTRRPKKDGFYDHSMNCTEYMELAFGFAQPSRIEVRKLDAKALRHAQQDTDPYDRLKSRLAVGASRRGGL